MDKQGCPSKQNKQITYIFDISENISETIWNFWHNVHRRREHRFVVKLTACNPDFRRTKPSFTKVRGIISILMWTWKFSPPCYTAWKSWIVNQGIWKSIFQLKKSCFDFLDWILINSEWISFRIKYTKIRAVWRNKSNDSLLQEIPADTNFENFFQRLEK